MEAAACVQQAKKQNNMSGFQKHTVKNVLYGALIELAKSRRKIDQICTWWIPSLQW